jgi:hypothetical protein
MIQVLSYFKPLHKAVRYFCNLCGKETGADEYQTAVARRLEAAEREGQYLFCLDCTPHVTKIVNEITAAETLLTAAAEKNIQDNLAERARELVAKLSGASGATSPPSVAPDSPPAATHRRRSPTSIPSPE